MIKISIIVAVYNLEKYISKCLDFLFKQDLPESEFEIIIVDDGSIDNSLEIIEEKCFNKKNVKILKQMNSTQSVARNKGLKIARGEYIWFVDGDDWINSNCLHSLVAICEKYRLDILHFSAVTRGEMETEYRTPLEIEDQVILGSMFLNLRRVPLNPPFYIYRRLFLKENNLAFYEGIYHEDNEYIPRTLYFSKRFMCISTPFYNVLKRPLSTTTTPNPKRLFDLLIASTSLIRFANTVKDRKSRTSVKFYAALSANSAFILLKQMPSEVRVVFKEDLKTKKRQIAYAMLSSFNLKYMAEGVVLLLSHSLFLKIFEQINRNRL